MEVAPFFFLNKRYGRFVRQMIHLADTCIAWMLPCFGLHLAWTWAARISSPSAGRTTIVSYTGVYSTLLDSLVGCSQASEYTWWPIIGSLLYFCSHTIYFRWVNLSFVTVALKVVPPEHETCHIELCASFNECSLQYAHSLHTPMCIVTSCNQISWRLPLRAIKEGWQLSLLPLMKLKQAHQNLISYFHSLTCCLFHWVLSIAG